MKNTILIVDDSEESRDLIKLYLREFKDCRVIEAVNGKAALGAIEKIVPDLILLDIVMPEMDGLEFCRLVKDKPILWDVPIIMVTAMEKGKGLQEAFDSGAMDYVRKPIEKTEIQARVRSALSLYLAITKEKGRSMDLMKATHKLESVNQKLEQLSLLDGLTGIANRRCFDQITRTEWLRALREKKPLSLIMADIDSFKLFNDNYGHQAGDSCLQRVAKTLESLVSRPGDMVARYGGEEFAAALSDTELDGALKLAEKMCASVKNLGVFHDHSTTAAVVTISMGVAAVVPGEKSSLKDLIAIADQALYRAKESGGNMVIAENNI